MHLTLQERKKYPRTGHLPFSAGMTSDDKMTQDFSKLEGKEVIATLKLDGENTTLYSDGYLHARSIDGTSNWTRDIAKRILAGISHEIPEGWRLCCENVYAEHSIRYPDGYLDGYLYLLSIWNEKNECLSWGDTEDFAQLLDLPQPKVLYKGIFDLGALKRVADALDPELEEGFVVRTTDGFAFEEFGHCVSKFVRANHVQTQEHWLVNAKPNGIPKTPSKPAFLQFNHK